MKKHDALLYAPESETEAASRSPYIVLEGLDGVGKSSVSRALARRLGGRVLTTPSREFGLTGRHIDMCPRGLVRLLYYLCAAAVTSDSARGLTRRIPVVADRYVLSALAYHAPPSHAAEVWRLGLLRPDVTVLLTADESVRRRRLRLRGPLSRSEKLLQEASVRREILETYRRFAPMEVDSSNLSVADVVGAILDLLSRGSLSTDRRSLRGRP